MFRRLPKPVTYYVSGFINFYARTVRRRQNQKPFTPESRESPTPPAAPRAETEEREKRQQLPLKCVHHCSEVAKGTTLLDSVIPNGYASKHLRKALAR